MWGIKQIKLIKKVFIKITKQEKGSREEYLLLHTSKEYTINNFASPAFHILQR